jgi:predicted nucleotidyltransferase
VTSVVDVPRTLAPYLDELVAALGRSAELEAVYLVGSAARGVYEHGPSDVDVVAVTSRRLSEAEKLSLVERVEALECPARGLELVVYAKGSQPPGFEINFNGGPRMERHVSFDPAAEPWHWFVIDAAIAEEHAVPLVGPPWRELFESISAERARAAVLDGLAWAERNEPGDANAARARHYLETGEWTTK